MYENKNYYVINFRIVCRFFFNNKVQNLMAYEKSSEVAYFDSQSRLFAFLKLCGSGSVFGTRIQIHKISKLGSNLDPDPQH